MEVSWFKELVMCEKCIENVGSITVLPMRAASTIMNALATLASGRELDRKEQNQLAIAAAMAGVADVQWKSLIRQTWGSPEDDQEQLEQETNMVAKCIERMPVHLGNAIVAETTRMVQDAWSTLLDQGRLEVMKSMEADAPPDLDWDDHPDDDEEPPF